MAVETQNAKRALSSTALTTVEAMCAGPSAGPDGLGKDNQLGGRVIHRGTLTQESETRLEKLRERRQLRVTRPEEP